MIDEIKKSLLEQGKNNPDNLPSLLLVDDDDAFRRRLAVALERRGYCVTSSTSVNDAKVTTKILRPKFAVIDLRIPDGSGLEVVAEVRESNPDARIIVLTGYGNIATAVAAVKAGAIDYLAKPADADEIDSALNMGDRPLPPPPENPMSADRVRWEHIQRVFQQCDCNVSETARRLGMHRRTLQRILAKYSPNE
ncbi:MAG: two-component system response regulator [Gammaproteobacteria bacterium]|jgi:two-component system response regulator RegA|nr:two-component system response regulator [Gammaproteobacteria bacterium]|tara:strand:+ start:1737 stop:2318 length:582 start_codon:yes stop_codon:yes gene_type:complete